MSWFYETHEYTDSFDRRQVRRKYRPGPITIACIVGLVLFIAAIIGLAAGCKAYNRYQARQDAENRVRVTKINQEQAANQVGVVQQQAQQKIAEARGIRESQDIINATLTPLYVQHEAIQAQLAMAHSPNHTEIYIPSGNNGVPLVKPVTP